jgi:hypothetical protein
MQRFKSRRGRMKPDLVLVKDDPERRLYSHRTNCVVVPSSLSTMIPIRKRPNGLLRCVRISATSMRHVKILTMHRARIWQILFVLLVARYGVSIYGTVTCFVKFVDMLRGFVFGFHMITCAILGFSCAIYCMYVNDDLRTLLSSSFQLSNDALDEKGAISSTHAVFRAIVEMLVGVAVQMLDTSNYRILREIESTWNLLHVLRFTIRTIARGEFNTLTRSILSWIETNTQLLLHIRNSWNAMSDVVADVIHDAADALQNITQSLAIHLTCSWKMLTNWVQQVARNVISNGIIPGNDVHKQIST